MNSLFTSYSMNSVLSPPPSLPFGEEGGGGGWGGVGWGGGGWGGVGGGGVGGLDWMGI